MLYNKCMKSVCIIGGGPVGLNAYIKFKEKGYIVKLYEAEPVLGGQIPKFYPEKKIEDLVDIKPLIASSYVNILYSLCDHRDIFLNTTVTGIKPAPKYRFIICSNRGEEVYDIVVLAVGVGLATPRKMGIEGEEACKNIFYSVTNKNDFKDKNIVIFGGGDTALDWTKQLTGIAKHITLVHRRDEFRGNADTVKGLSNLRICLSFVPLRLNIQDSLAVSVVIQSVKDKHTETLNCDAVICNFGTVPQVNKFMLSKEEGPYISVNKDCETIYKNVFAIGDVCNYDGKKRRIEPGIDEVQRVIKKIESVN